MLRYVDKVSMASSAPAGTVRRLMKEIRELAAGDDGLWMHTGEGVHCFPAQEDITVWRVLIEGPAGTPFEGGTFALAVRVPQNYPLSPPSISFVTPIYHCNVSESGLVCLDVLKEKWSPALTIPKALIA